MTALIGGSVLLIVIASVTLIMGWGGTNEPLIYTSAGSSVAAAVCLALAWYRTKAEARKIVAAANVSEGVDVDPEPVMVELEDPMPPWLPPEQLWTKPPRAPPWTKPGGWGRGRGRRRDRGTGARQHAGFRGDRGGARCCRGGGRGVRRRLGSGFRAIVGVGAGGRRVPTSQEVPPVGLSLRERRGRRGHHQARGQRSRLRSLQNLQAVAR